MQTLNVSSLFGFCSFYVLMKNIGDVFHGKIVEDGGLCQRLRCES